MNIFFDKGADVSEIGEPMASSKLKIISVQLDIVRKLGTRNEIDNFSTEKFDKIVKLCSEKFDLKDVLDFQIREDMPGPWLRRI